MTCFPPTLTGEMSTEPTIFHGTRTSTFPNIADHAGLRDLLHPLLIDSTSSSETPTPLPLPSPLKLWLTAMPVELAMVVTHQVSTIGLTTTVSPTPVASNTSPRTLTKMCAIQSTSAEIAHGLLLQSTRLARINVGLLTTRSTMFQTTTVSLVLTR